MPSNQKGCPIHGLTWWMAHPSDYDDAYCQRCYYADKDVKLGDMTGDTHNGAGCYDHDSDFSN